MVRKARFCGLKPEKETPRNNVCEAGFFSDSFGVPTSSNLAGNLMGNLMGGRRCRWMRCDRPSNATDPLILAFSADSLLTLATRTPDTLRFGVDMLAREVPGSDSLEASLQFPTKLCWYAHRPEKKAFSGIGTQK